MAAIHHMTLKLAANKGLKLVVTDKGVETRTDDSDILVCIEATGKESLARAIEEIEAFMNDNEMEDFDEAREAWAEEQEEREPEEDADDAEGDEDGEGGKSVVKRKYKQAYRPFKMTCGDDLSQLITAHVSRKVQVDGKTTTRVDAQVLRRFANANGVWQDKYSYLNTGMQRMNVANRLRKLAKNPDFKIKWVK